MTFLQHPIRTSQLIAPWGVGAIVPFPDGEVMMIAGLDFWDFGNGKAQFEVADPRLARRLGVEHLRKPPDYQDAAAGGEELRIPGVRFPRWHYCPKCGRMELARADGRPPVCSGTKGCSGTRMIPERFVVVCPKGHIDDFPIYEWVHQNGPADSGVDHHITRTVHGGTSSLAAITYKCSCGERRNLWGATRHGALGAAGYVCAGSRPWLGEFEGTTACGCPDVRVVQRGGTNVWFSNIVSSLYIPVEHGASDPSVIRCANQLYPKLTSRLHNPEEAEETLAIFLEMNGQDEIVSSSAVMKILLDKYSADQGDREQQGREISEDEYRRVEYDFMSSPPEREDDTFAAAAHGIDDYDSAIHPYLDGVTLVSRLKETRAFVGFSRLQADFSTSFVEQRKQLSRKLVHWVPAIENYGEGILLRFDHDRLASWSSRKDVRARAALLSESYNHYLKELDRPQVDVSAKYVLIHTLAHLLINQVSYECGYGSSSIRERLYCGLAGGDDMSGLLMYTAASDADGSLGGLVRQGRPGRLEDSLLESLRNAQWCSSDPICIQSTGQGPDSCNLAACHNCVLLPETCCEVGNRLLDRGLVIGTLDNPDLGYFSELLTSRG